MIVHPASTRLHAQTTVIDDPGDLIDYMTPESVAILRGGDGVVGIGEITRFNADSPDAADVWWQEFSSQVEHESELVGVRGTGVLAFGSFAFDPDNTVEPSVLIVPEVIIGRRDGLCWLTRVAYNRATSEMPERQSPPEPPTDMTLIAGDAQTDDYRTKVEALLAVMIRDGIDSVVLSRKLVAEAREPIDLRWIVRRLSHHDPASWTYLVDGTVGSTRDLLVGTDHRLAISRVLAGSTPAPSGNAERPNAWANLVRTSNWHKHIVAREWVINTMREFCDAVYAPTEPYVMRTPDTWTLTTDVTGVVSEGTSSLGIAAALHPTAAAAGSPRRAALDVINEVEGADRGHFSGPVGWVDSQGEGEWVVAFGGQVNAATPNRIEMFAGSGVVRESDAAWELGMTVGKFRTMLRALGLPTN